MQCLDIHHAVTSRKLKTIPDCINNYKPKILNLILTEKEIRKIVNQTLTKETFSNSALTVERYRGQSILPEVIANAQKKKVEARQ